jgi:hypothetical protein
LLEVKGISVMHGHIRWKRSVGRDSNQGFKSRIAIGHSANHKDKYPLYY